MRRLLLLAVLIAMPHIASAQPAETIEYYGQDVIGSVRIVFAPNGAVLGRQDYEPFGRPLFTAPGMPSEQFVENVHDAETRLSSFHARQYATSDGRFTRIDPVAVFVSTEPQQLNRYAYSRNNPLRFTDPMGLQEDEAGRNDGGKKKRCEPFNACVTSVPACQSYNCPDGTIMMAGVPSPGAAAAAIGALMARGGALPRSIGRAGERALERLDGIRVHFRTDWDPRFLDSL